MEIEILAFGIAKDLIGDRHISISVEKSINISELKLELIKRYPDFEKLSSFSLAVNEEYQENDYELQDKDEVAIIPPVSGG